MGILAWIVLGLIAGAIAKAIMPGKDPGGIIVTMLIGIIGAFLGGFLGNMIAGMFGSDKAQAAEPQADNTEAEVGDAEDASVADTDVDGGGFGDFDI